MFLCIFVLSKSNDMTTIQQILTENRDSVISSIKYVFKVYSGEALKNKMIGFLQFAEKVSSVEELQNSKRVKADLKSLVCKYSISLKSNDNRKWNEIAESIADERGLIFDTLNGGFKTK